MAGKENMGLQKNLFLTSPGTYAWILLLGNHYSFFILLGLDILLIRR